MVDSGGDNKPNDKQIGTVSQVPQRKALVEEKEELKIRVSLVQEGRFDFDKVRDLAYADGPWLVTDKGLVPRPGADLW
jgi:hypothetical protein